MNEAGHVEEVPDELISRLLEVTTTMFRLATHDGGRDIPAFSENSTIAATSVVVTVSAMLRSVGMNPFDLSLWFGRPRD